MARLTILLPLIALILFAAHASARRHQEDEEQSMCERELEDLNLRHCEQHIMQKIQRHDEEEDEDQEDEENFLRMRGIKSNQHHHNNPFFRGNYKKKCCTQLRELEDNPQCMCEALQQIKENQEEQLQGKQVQRMEKELRNLPQSCGLSSPPRRCDLSSQQN